MKNCDGVSKELIKILKKKQMDQKHIQNMKNIMKIPPPQAILNEIPQNLPGSEKSLR